MKHLFLVLTAAACVAAASSASAQTTQDATSTTTTGTRQSTDSTTTAVRRSTKKQSTVQTTTQATISARNNARLNARLRNTQQTQVTTTTRAPRLDGGVVRAVRSDNPLQAINPLAPAEYGTGEQVTRHEPDDPFQRPQGLNLVVIEF